MSDPPPTKPKPGSLKDRIKAFEGGGTTTATTSTPQYEKPAVSGGMSASDAKESIKSGGFGSLKERMAALQGRSGFGGSAPAPPPPAPKPIVKKTFSPPLPTVPTSGGISPDSLPIQHKEMPSSSPTPTEEATVPNESEEKDISTDVAQEQDQESLPVAAEKTEEQEEGERRAAIAARMARLGGARIGMAPPVFGRSPPIPVRKPSVNDVTGEKTEEAPSRIALPGIPTPLSVSETSQETLAAENEQITSPSQIPLPAQTPSESLTAPPQPVLLVGPKRAAPPRKKRPSPSPSQEDTVQHETVNISDAVDTITKDVSEPAESTPTKETPGEAKEEVTELDDDLKEEIIPQNVKLPPSRVGSMAEPAQETIVVVGEHTSSSSPPLTVLSESSPPTTTPFSPSHSRIESIISVTDEPATPPPRSITPTSASGSGVDEEADETFIQETEKLTHVHDDERIPARSSLHETESSDIENDDTLAEHTASSSQLLEEPSTSNRDVEPEADQSLLPYRKSPGSIEENALLSLPENEVVGDYDEDSDDKPVVEVVKGVEETGSGNITPVQPEIPFSLPPHPPSTPVPLLEPAEAHDKNKPEEEVDMSNHEDPTKNDLDSFVHDTIQTPTGDDVVLPGVNYDGNQELDDLAGDEPSVPETLLELEEPEDEEVARRRRIAQMMAKMGGFNPFGASSAPLPKPLSRAILPDSSGESRPTPESDQAETPDDKIATQEALNPEQAPADEETEADRRRRISEKMAKMGGFNPFGVPRQSTIPPIPSNPTTDETPEQVHQVEAEQLSAAREMSVVTDNAETAGEHEDLEVAGDAYVSHEDNDASIKDASDNGSSSPTTQSEPPQSEDEKMPIRVIRPPPIISPTTTTIESRFRETKPQRTLYDSALVATSESFVSPEENIEKVPLSPSGVVSPTRQTSLSPSSVSQPQTESTQMPSLSRDISQRRTRPPIPVIPPRPSSPTIPVSLKMPNSPPVRSPTMRKASSPPRQSSPPPILSQAPEKPRGHAPALSIMSIDLPVLSPSNHSEFSAHLESPIDDEMTGEGVGDPIDPLFYSPNSPNSRKTSSLRGSSPDDSTRESPPPVAETGAGQSVALPADEQIEEDPESARRRAIAERMARLGGVKFGAAPPMPRRQATSPERPSEAHVKSGVTATGAEAEDFSEEAMREKRRAIAARLAGQGGMRVGMNMFGIAPVPPPAKKPDASSSSITVSEDPDDASQTPSASEDGIKIEAEESEVEVTKSDLSEEGPPPPVPSRPSRALPSSSKMEAPPPPRPFVLPPGPSTISSPIEVAAHYSPPTGAVSDFVMIEPDAEIPPLPPPRQSGGSSRSKPPPAPPSHSTTASVDTWALPSIPKVSLDFSPGDVDLSQSTSTHWSDDSTSYTSLPPKAVSKEAATIRPSVAPRAPPKQKLTPDDLLAIWGRVGVQVHTVATNMYSISKLKSTLIGDGSFIGFVNAVLMEIPNAALPDSDSGRSYGHLFYSQTGATVTRRAADISPGDIVLFENCHFHGRKGLQSYNITIGSPSGGEDVVGIVSETETKRNKIKVFMANQHVGGSSVETASYRLEELRSGTVKVFRVAEVVY